MEIATLFFQHNPLPTWNSGGLSEDEELDPSDLVLYIESIRLPYDHQKTKRRLRGVCDLINSILTTFNQARILYGRMSRTLANPLGF
jgi:hypothetical protein